MPATWSQRWAGAFLEIAYAGDWPARLWGLLPHASRVQRLEYDIPSPGGRGARPPLRVSFLSDLHFGPTTPLSVLDAAFDDVRAMNADVLVLGGDFVYLEATEKRVAALCERVASVSAPTKVGVLGNHDYWTDTDQISIALEAAGVRILTNDAIRLPPPHDDVAIVGLDDPWMGKPDPDAALARAAGATTTLAVCHSPDGAPLLEGRGVLLLMCGHTHGGQVALPGSIPVVMPCRHGRRWPHGRHRVGDMELFVSRGVGNTGVALRTFAPPDVALFIVR